MDRMSAFHHAGLLDLHFLRRILSDPGQNRVRVAHGCGEYFPAQVFISADMEEKQKSQQDIFAAPDVPFCELRLRRIGGKGSVRILSGQKVAYRLFHYGIQPLIPRRAVYKNSAAHHLSPVFRAPFPLRRIGFQAILFHKFCPQLPVTQLSSHNKIQRFPAYALRRNTLKRIRFQSPFKAPVRPAMPEKRIFLQAGSIFCIHDLLLYLHSPASQDKRNSILSQSCHRMEFLYIRQETA